MYVYDRLDLYISHGTITLFNISFLKHSQLSPLWVLKVTEILESLIGTMRPQLKTVIQKLILYRQYHSTEMSMVHDCAVILLATL